MRGNSGSMSATHVQSMPLGVVDSPLLLAALPVNAATIILRGIKSAADVRDLYLRCELCAQLCE
jgi:hypothetical protein